MFECDSDAIDKAISIGNRRNAKKNSVLERDEHKTSIRLEILA